MATLTCPLCGSPAHVPSEEIHKRHECRKCHSPFHLNKSRIAVVGEPPSVDQELAELKQKLREVRERIPAGRIVAGLSALAAVGLIGYVFFGPARRLEGPAERAARALAEEDLGYLRSIAAPGTEDDVARWFEAVQPRLEQARATWHGREETIEVHVAQEDPGLRKGSVGVSIHPGTLGSQDVSALADPSAAIASAASTFDTAMEWTLGRWGRWKLDGRETYARARPEEDPIEAASDPREGGPAGSRPRPSTRRS